MLLQKAPPLLLPLSAHTGKQTVKVLDNDQQHVVAKLVQQRADGGLPSPLGPSGTGLDHRLDPFS